MKLKDFLNVIEDFEKFTLMFRQQENNGIVWTYKEIGTYYKDSLGVKLYLDNRIRNISVVNTDSAEYILAIDIEI